MKIVYVGNNAARRRAVSPDDDIIALRYDNWNDFGYETTFPTLCYIGGKKVELGPIRILFGDEKQSHAYLEQKLADGWDGVFPVPGMQYISTPTSITFYELLLSQIGQDGAVSAAVQLRDASWLAMHEEDESALALIAGRGFTDSLQRERGGQKAFVDGWKLLAGNTVAVRDFSFGFSDLHGEISTLHLKFEADTPLPHDINVLIGANGVGKSQLMQQMVSQWLTIERSATQEEVIQPKTGFSYKPNLSQLVLISYSPFELFPVDAKDKVLIDKGVYRYFGLRGRDTQDQKTIMLSRRFPKTNAAHSLVACLADDQRYGSIKAWSKKLRTMHDVLQSAIGFDYAAVRLRKGVKPQTVVEEDPLTYDPWLTIPEDGRDRIYVPIAQDRLNMLDPAKLSKAIDAPAGVTFFKDGQALHLSSGQRLFSYIVVNILGAIRRHSLILVDEPELFLHPTLEIQFVEMLKTILANYVSKALLATHSVVTVREMPSDCVHVLEDSDDGLIIKQPPFETFGGDVQRISSYVFGDKAVSKPFERWVSAKLEEYGSAAALFEALGDHLNEELRIQITAMARDQW